MVTRDLPAGLPPMQRRPSSASYADVYGSTAANALTTPSAGSVGGQRVGAANADDNAPPPISINGFSPDFLRKPAGVLLLIVIALAILSWLDL